jgi:hypothetical protein
MDGRGGSRTAPTNNPANIIQEDAFMTRQIFSIALFTLFTLCLPLAAESGKKIPCRYGCQECLPYGCVPEDTAVNRDAVISKQQAGKEVKTFCGKCFEDADCGGAKCEKGLCKKYVDPVPPRPVRPAFHLVTTQIAFAKDTSSFAGVALHPIIGAGYQFESAFGKVNPIKQIDGSFIAANLPKWYWHAGGSVAFSGESQNVFAELGLSYYYPLWAVSSYSLFGLYQRSGPALWKNSSSDRAGGAICLNFMQNVSLKAGYLWPAHGSGKRGIYLSVEYMKDLLGDIIPDRYRKYLPKSLAG